MRTPKPAPAMAAGAATPKVPILAGPMLPETLRLSLPERNPPSIWPRMITLPALDYPEAARAKGVQGVVWVLALVDTAGEVRSTRVDRGIPGLNESALAWVTEGRFAPCLRDGATSNFWIRVAVRFTPP
jgi:TonB family protein